MRNKTIKNLRFISAPIFFLLCALFLVCGSTAQAAETTQKHLIVRELSLNVEMLKIVPVLEDKIGDRKLLERSKEKIYTMNSRELHLIADLCEKISSNGQTISSDIAFLLVSALIVLS